MKISLDRSVKNSIVAGLATFTIAALTLMPTASLFAGDHGNGGGNSGHVYTTNISCGSPQDSNHYSVGDHIYIYGDGFDGSTSYPWSISETGHGHPEIASGNKTTNADGSFCFDAHTIQPGEDGEYQVKFNDVKGDNYQVGGVVLPPPPVAPFITVTKVVLGGQLTPSDFPLFVGTSQVTSGQTIQVSAGGYVISETQQPNYTQTSIGGDCAADGSITLANGDNKTCTITNTYVAPRPTTGTIIVDKVIVGNASASADLFSFQVNAGASVSFEADGSNQLSAMATGSYVITEPVATNYATTYSNCSFELTAGETETCTITNTYVQPSTPPSPTDVCPNLEGAQTVVPDGYHLSDGRCVQNTQETDPTPTPTPTPSTGGGGGGGFVGGVAFYTPSPSVTPEPSSTPAPTETPEVLGASTQLPATGISGLDALIISLCAGLFAAGVVLVASSVDRKALSR